MCRQITGTYMHRKWSAIFTLAIALLLSISTVSAQNQTIGAGLEGQILIDYIQQNYTPNQVLGYNTARDTMYAVIDNNNGDLTGVYTGFTITLNPSQDPSTDAYNKGINAEHTWPQSMGAGTEPGKSDIHNLFPAKSNVNSARNNDLLGEIDDNLTDTWYYLDQSQTTIPTSNMELYAENYGSTTFEPREQHKGNAARAIFYFVAIYQNEADSTYFEQQKEDLYNWHYLDEVDAGERTRSSAIAGYQGNENPFILDTSLVRRAFFPNGSSAGAIVFSEIFYDTPGTDSNEEWIELYNGTSSTVDLAGYSVTDNNGTGSSYTFPSGSSIAPGSYVTVATNASGFNACLLYTSDAADE